MKYLDRIVLRELLAAKSRAMTLILALAVAFAIPAGMDMGLASLIATRDTFTTRLGLADLEVRLLPEDVRNFPKWAEVPGVERVEQRLLMPGTIERDGHSLNALMIFLDEAQPQINRLELRSGRTAAEGALNEAVVERSAETYHNLTTGSAVTVQVGHQRYEQQLVGVAASAEFLMVAANPEFFLPEKGSLAVVYTNLERVYESLGFKMVNDLLFRFSPGADPEVTKQAILRQLGNKRIERVTARDEHLSFKHIAIDYDVFRIFQPAISLVLALLAAALVVISFDRIVRRQRQEFGALKALGYGALELTRAYLLAAGVLAVIGCILGAIGAVGFRTAFLQIYARAHGLAYLEQHLDLIVLLRSALIVIALALLSAWFATWRLRRADPLALMRSVVEQPSTGGLARIGSSYPLWLRLGLNNLRRSPRLVLTTIVSVGLSIAVGVSYLVCLDSMNAAISRSFDAQPWDRAVSFLYPTLDEEYAELVDAVPGARAEGFVRAQGTLRLGDASHGASLLGVGAQGQLRHVNLASGRMPVDEREIVLGMDLARKVGAELGTTLTLEVRNERHAVQVVGLKSDVVLYEAVMDIRALQSFLELEDQATGMFVSASPEATQLLDATLLGADFVGRVTHKSALVAEFKSILQDIRKLVLLVAVVALTVAVIFVAANLSMSLQERAVEFSTLWALGCEQHTARRIVLTDGLFQAVGALLVAVPGTWFLSRVLNQLASRAWFDQPTFISTELVVVTVLCTLAFTTLGALVAFRGFWAEDHVQRLRVRAIQ